MIDHHNPFVCNSYSCYMSGYELGQYTAPTLVDPTLPWRIEHLAVDIVDSVDKFS